MRFWLRNLAIGAGVGFAVGLVVGGTVGRIFMRILFLAKEDNAGFATAMGAIVGDLTREGTSGIYGFAAIAGVALGLAYTAGRALLPSGTRLRVTVFTPAPTKFPWRTSRMTPAPASGSRRARASAASVHLPRETSSVVMPRS